MKADRKTVLELLRAYLDEYGPQGYDRETFVDWVVTQSGAVRGDANDMIRLYERRIRSIRLALADTQTPPGPSRPRSKRAPIEPIEPQQHQPPTAKPGRTE